MTFERAYRTFRSPRIFLRVLCIVCFTWIVWNLQPWFPHFDDEGFGRLNLLLSVEASIASAVLLAVQERQEQHNVQQLRYMLDMMEAITAMLNRRNDIPREAGNVGDVAANADSVARLGVASSDSR